MPRFYFDFEVGDNHYSDDDGVELESLEAARKSAFRVVPALSHYFLITSTLSPFRIGTKVVSLTIGTRGELDIFILTARSYTAMHGPWVRRDI
jgi:hypothetical protein